MLKLQSCCENCGKDLAPASTEAMICSFECTFCKTCVQEILKNICPNCGGGFESRPIRPKEALKKYAPSSKVVKKGINYSKHNEFLTKYLQITPEKR